MDQNLPLAGIRVISLEQAVAAPFASRQLADLGAEVIKIERPGKGDFARDYDDVVDGMSSYFVWLNRSKRSLTLDVKSAQGRTVLARLLSSADVFVHNLGPGAVERLGFGPDELATLNPDLIDCAITGFGSDGAWADRKAYDLLIQCQTGLVSITGTPESGARVGISVADIAGGMYAYSGVLAALFTRATTGTARAVQVSLFDALSEWMSQPAYYTRYSGQQPPRLGTHHATIAPYGAYEASDGCEVLFSIQNDREWRGFCEQILAAPELVEDPRFATSSVRVAHRAELDPVIARHFAAHPSREIQVALDAAGIANSAINTVTDFLDHPVLEERGAWVPVETPTTTVDSLLPPARLGGVEPRMGRVPSIGEDAQAILVELGYSDEDIEGFRATGVI
ncbi:CoA transferase [Aeromicrobium sp. YIM 150415]|uniref:CaiB/BaiF CoA transferase family protein n=1 Tax=Aeromicrobium sp. YIM 150415 TaxID=2803912 RepID=UPI001962F733|nr:CaiB/BaiF CoA-transferase family protein [Aeromicrobium sp. YIM 150415]MBM9464034.1 CoA transferase [Aeromicrobium sp. YIM 150415]